MTPLCPEPEGDRVRRGSDGTPTTSPRPHGDVSTSAGGAGGAGGAAAMSRLCLCRALVCCTACPHHITPNSLNEALKTPLVCAGQSVSALHGRLEPLWQVTAGLQSSSSDLRTAGETTRVAESEPPLHSYDLFSCSVFCRVMIVPTCCSQGSPHNCSF